MRKAKAHKCPANVLDPIIKRLRESQDDWRSDADGSGHIFGVDWAKETASVGELRRLAAIHDELILEPNDALFVFVKSLHPDVDRNDVEDFWEAIDVDIDDYADREDAFVHGFIHGALEVWVAVEASI